MREDIHGEPRAPKELADYLVKIGGKNPFGEPMYRLIHCSTRYQKRGGRYNDWDENLTIQQRGGICLGEDGSVTPSLYKPMRIVVEMREVLKYPTMKNRWIVERWQPAFFHGSEENWNRIYVKDRPDMPIMGPYPFQGDYWQASGPAEEIPGVTRLREVVSDCEAFALDHRNITEGECAQAIADAEFEDEQRSIEYQKYVESYLKDKMIPLGRVSLAAGRHRNMLAERAGVKEHAGN